MSVKAMILAAGAGTRLEPLTSNLPKPLVPIANIPVMEHIIQNLEKHGITEIIANTYHLADKISTHFNNHPLENVKLELLQENELSGTAGGVKKCEWFFNNGETFIVMGGDALTDINIQALIEKHKASDSIATIALKSVPREDVNEYGVVVTDTDGKVTEFQEKPTVEEAKSNLVSTCIYIFEPEIFDYIPENTFYDFAKQVFPSLMKDKKPIYAFEIDEYWNDIGTLLQYRLSSYDVINEKININIPGKKFEHGWLGNNVDIGNNVSFNSKVIIGNNCIIEDNVIFNNNVTLGDNVKVAKNSKLTGCVILQNADIGENVELNECIIGSNVIIADNVTTKTNVTIGDNCFVEPDKIIGEGTKTNCIRTTTKIN